MNYKDIITLEPGKRGSKPCIRGMRMTVYDVLEYLATGMSHSEILQDLPYLRSCTFLNSPPSNEFGANRQNPLKWVESQSAQFLSPFQRTSLG